MRGLANVDVTPEMAMRLAMSYGTLITKGSYVTTSRDTHHACRVFKRAIISGLNSTGVNVRDLTTAPLAVNRFDIKSGNAIGGIHVQMSLDNPEQIEILFSEAPGVPLDGKRERAIENHYFREDFRRAAFEEMGQVVYPPRVIETYTNSLLENWNTVAITGQAAPPGARLLARRRRPSSSRPPWTSSAWRPSPSTPSPGAARASRSRRACPAAAARVGEMVRAMEADLGAILDPGAEYLYVVDEKGRPGPRLRAAAPAAAARRPRRGRGSGGPASARHPPGRAGGRLHRRQHPPHQVLQGRRDGRGDPSQHGLRRHHRRRLHLPVGAALAGRASTRWARCWSWSPRPTRPCRNSSPEMPVAHVVHLQVDCPWELKGTVMRRMTEKLHDGRVSLVDGIKVFLDHGEWALVLPDAEEPLFHVYAEAADDARAARAGRQVPGDPAGSRRRGPGLGASGAARRRVPGYASVLLAMTCLQTVLSVSNTPTPREGAGLDHRRVRCD